MMKENPNIDELLNGFVDGELTERQQIEVRRLVSHDEQAARRLRELQKCKMLVSSLPVAEAPPEMLEQVKASLSRETLVLQEPSGFDRREGFRHLAARRILAAAAMIGLVAVLATVVYTIVSPEGSTTPPEPVHTVATAPPVFYGTLKLKPANFMAVNGAINRAIEHNGLSDYLAPETGADTGVYTFSCDRESLKRLLADLRNIWERLDSAALVVETDRFGQQVLVDAVTVEQIGELVNKDSLEERVKAANGFAVSNRIAELMPGQEILVALEKKSGDFDAILEPVLVSAEKDAKEPAAKVEGKEEVHLTIVLTDGE
ncbi:MAG: anti-sigma factor family protein [Planctomycetota bacterium]